MRSPTIGLTTLHSRLPGKDFDYLSITEKYVTALVQAGAIPVLVPLALPETYLDELLNRLDGIIFTGGGDIQPQRFGGRDHPLLENVDPERDRVELHLARRAADTHTPFLGICRGLQTVNVALGGSLHGDIQTELPGSLRHAMFERGPRDRLVHPVRIEEGSQLASILEQPIVQVNSGHHQAAKEVPEVLTVTAYAPDGVIEAFELQDHPFGLAVQWHPEWLTHIPEMLSLFKALVAAAQNHR